MSSFETVTGRLFSKGCHTHEIFIIGFAVSPTTDDITFLIHEDAPASSEGTDSETQCETS
jgi:hypothetical protein